MDYFNRYIGGPADGLRESSPTGERYPNFTLRQLVSEAEFDRLAIYKFDKEHVNEETTERAYQFVKSLPIGDATDFLHQHSKWLP